MPALLAIRLVWMGFAFGKQLTNSFWASSLVAPLFAFWGVFLSTPKAWPSEVFCPWKMACPSKEHLSNCLPQRNWREGAERNESKGSGSKGRLASLFAGASILGLAQQKATQNLPRVL